MATTTAISAKSQQVQLQTLQPPQDQNTLGRSTKTNVPNKAETTRAQNITIRHCKGTIIAIEKPFKTCPCYDCNSVFDDILSG
jgi:hypothetical protein